MISSTGRNLSVLIISETGMDWQTFATWYSFYKNLPDAKLSLYCHRNSDFSFVYFQWAKRLKIPCMKAKPYAEGGSEYINWLGALKNAQDSGLSQQPVLIVRPYVMAIDAISNRLLKKFQTKKAWKDDYVLYVNEQNIDELIYKYYIEDDVIESPEEKICYDAKLSTDLHSLVSYQKGCGRWIDTAKGCPFSSAGGLITSELTANETRVIELWKKMVPLYQAVV